MQMNCIHEQSQRNIAKIKAKKNNAVRFNQKNKTIIFLLLVDA